MNITVLGIDLAKNVFQLHGVNAQGKVVLRRTISRSKLTEFVANLPRCLIGMEACCGANYWGRKFQTYGHEVKLMSPQFVKPYVKTNKNDYNDAEAICEAVTRPNMRFVAIKNVEQQDIQAIHRIRSGLIQRRTALVNQIRGLLSEYGIIVKQGVNNLKIALPLILEDAENNLTIISRELFANLYRDLLSISKEVQYYNNKIERISRSSEICRRLVEIPGVGSLTATSIMAAWLGLVPRQYSSGGKQLLLGISKRGDRYIRSLLIHGARSVIRRIGEKIIINPWLSNLIERRGKNKASVALANKNARTIWTIMKNNCEYKIISH